MTYKLLSEMQLIVTDHIPIIQGLKHSVFRYTYREQASNIIFSIKTRIKTNILDVGLTNFPKWELTYLNKTNY